MSNEIAILGAGMHPWGKWGHNFVQYGVAAAREALKDAGVPWQDVRFVSGGATVRCGYPGYVAGATFAQALGWQGAEVNTSYAACASGSQALAAARNKILAGECDVALVVGADTTPKGFLAPAGGYRPEDPDWVRFYLGITNPTYFALYARRRMDLYGDTLEDFAAVKQALEETGFTPESGEVTMIASTTVPVDADGAETLMGLVEALEDLDDVQNVFTNAEIDEEILDRL